MAVRRGSWDDFDAVAVLTGNREGVRSRWELPSFDPARHLWLAGDAFGALYSPDEAVVAGDARRAGALLERIEAEARGEGLTQLLFVIPASDAGMRRAYETHGFRLATEVLELEIRFGEDPPVEAAPPPGVELRTYTDADARAVQALLDSAYAEWDETYIPFAHDDWLSFMTAHESFDPECWFLAEKDAALAGVCLTWKEGWIKDLAVAPGARGRGLGDSLLRRAFARLHERGVRRIGLKVDAANPTGAVRLYERLGMRVAKRHCMYVKPL